MAAHAWNGRGTEARSIWGDIASTVTTASPDPVGCRGIGALMPSATALPLIGEIEACAALYPALEALPSLGWVSPFGLLGPTSPQLALAVSADAAGLFDRARAHFEEALRFADTLPDRLLQPAVKVVVRPASRRI